MNNEGRDESILPESLFTSHERYFQIINAANDVRGAASLQFAISNKMPIEFRINVFNDRDGVRWLCVNFSSKHADGSQVDGNAAKAVYGSVRAPGFDVEAFESFILKMFQDAGVRGQEKLRELTH